MIATVRKEQATGERRVALVPDSLSKLEARGVEVRVQQGAGVAAGYPDTAYEAAGARLGVDDAALLGEADVLVCVQAPALDAVARMRRGAVLIGLLQPLTSPDLVRSLADAGVTSIAMELVPRITRAQRMDVLSSQATAAGYFAALLAAEELPRFFPMLMTAAGTIPPAKVLVLGAGVAGLQAIATARRLGAVVQGFDIRPAVKEQVESLGATFVGLTVEEAETEGGYAKEVGEDVHRREQELLTRLVADADAVITTAQVPGRRAPVLVTRAMVEGMRPGSVVVDLAAETGGNCELTDGDRVVEQDGVRVIGLTNAASHLAYHASQMYARNVLDLMLHLIGDDGLHIDTADEITAGCLVTHGGEIVHARVRQALDTAGR